MSSRSRHHALRITYQLKPKMQTIEELKRKIQSTQDLQTVVKTMKAMAAVKIRQFEKAADALDDYNQTVEMGLQVILRNRPGLLIGARGSSGGNVGAVIFGSDQGMCGQINDQIVSHAMDTLDKNVQINTEERLIIAVGERIRARLADMGRPVLEHIQVPASVTGITRNVQDLVSIIEAWNRNKNLYQVYLFYSRHLSGARYQPHTVHLFPLDHQWLENLRQKPWPTRSVPMFTSAWDPMFSAMIRQYIFVSIFRAFAESLASENASRLAAMQGAEKNIQERISALNNQYHQRRQMLITEELLDIVSGFEALKKK